MRHGRRVLVCGVVLFSFLLAAQIAQARRGGAVVNAKSAILVDMTSGDILFEQNSSMRIAPASITKVMTLYIIFDAVRDGRIGLHDRVIVSARAASAGGSTMNIRAGEEVTVEELVKGAAIISGNDAAVALAEYHSGSVEAFVRKMNAKARELGMRNTTFMTPNGLPADGQLTTAADIAKLSVAYLRRFPEALNIHCMTTYGHRGRTHHNANRLLGTCEGVDGLKTGFVCSSGFNISATAKRNGTRLLAVVMGAPGPGARAMETRKLLDAGFQNVNGGPTVSMALLTGSIRTASVSKAEGPRGSLRKANGRYVVKKGRRYVTTVGSDDEGAGSCVVKRTKKAGNAKGGKKVAVAASKGKKKGSAKQIAAASGKAGSRKGAVAAASSNTRVKGKKGAVEPARTMAGKKGKKTILVADSRKPASASAAGKGATAKKAADAKVASKSKGAASSKSAAVNKNASSRKSAASAKVATAKKTAPASKQAVSSSKKSAPAKKGADPKKSSDTKKKTQTAAKNRQTRS